MKPHWVFSLSTQITKLNLHGLADTTEHYQSRTLRALLPHSNDKLICPCRYAAVGGTILSEQLQKKKHGCGAFYVFAKQQMEDLKRPCFRSQVLQQKAFLFLIYLNLFQNTALITIAIFVGFCHSDCLDCKCWLVLQAS